MNYQSVRQENRRLKTLALLFLFFMVWGLAGCGAEEPTVEPATVDSTSDAREPAVSRSWEARVDVVHPERDPFKVATAEVLPRERAEIVAEGRDPFKAVDNVVDVPQPEPPDDPVIPDENGEDPSAEGLLAISVVTVDRCWLDVQVDGERVIRTNVPVGEALYWEGQTVIMDQVGRDYALALTLNGRNLGVLSQQLVPALEQGPVVYEFDDVRVRVTLDRRHMGGVLLGLRFQVID